MLALGLPSPQSKKKDWYHSENLEDNPRRNSSITRCRSLYLVRAYFAPTNLHLLGSNTYIGQNSNVFPFVFSSL